MKKAKLVSIVSAVMASIYPLLGLFGVDIQLENWQTVTAAIISILGLFGSTLGESPVQEKIEHARTEAAIRESARQAKR